MKFNKKYCLLFLMTVLVLLLGAGMVSASEAGSDVQVVKDNQGLSTPDNYDVDNVVQSDRVLTKSEANVEKTSTKDDTNNNESSIDTFVDTDNTNEDLQTIASGSGHSAKVSVNEISGRTLNIAGLENSELLQETIDVGKISINGYDSLTGSEDMTPILTGETTDSSKDLVDTNTKSNVKSQETDKTIVKVESDQDIKAADGDLPKKVIATVTAVFDDFDNKYNSRPTSGSGYTFTFKRYYTATSSNNTNGSIAIKPGNEWTNQTILLDAIYPRTGEEYLRYNLTAPSGKPTGYMNPVITNTSSVYEETIDDVTYNITKFDYTVTYKLQNISLNVYKIWRDNNDNDRLRPANYTYTLYANGVENSTYTVPKGTSSKTYNNVPVIDEEGNEILWTVKEDPVPEGYTVEYANYTSTTRTLRLNITNIHKLIETEFTVSKVWNDSEDNDGVRPSEVYVQLYAYGYREGGVVKLDEDSGWTYTFKNLQKYYQGEEINYTVKEVNGPFDYVASYDGGIITNTHEPLKINITVNKTWNDSDDKDGLRPKNITVTLNADGVPYGDSVVLSEDNNWTGTFVNLPKYVNKNRVNYTFTETVPEGYNVTYGDIVPIKDKKRTQITLELLNLTRNEENNLTG
ncbi:Cna B-type domain-containing protein, partial [Methanosphaera sp.]|uniref:Cna B-type domain-containing protein n=2 Tax=Methanosphaera sp. TaxID=2666342 RepID=UPI002E75AFF8